MTPEPPPTGPPVSFDDLVERARGLLRPGSRAVLGIAGSPGAGKTTLAQRLVAALARPLPAGADAVAAQLPRAEGVAHVPMDGFHLADRELARLRRTDRKGAPDTFDAVGYAALLRRVRTATDETVYAPAFDREIEQPVAGSIPVLPACRLVVSEGNYLLVDTDPWRQVRDCFDEVWFCDLDDVERQRRLSLRHQQFGKDADEALRWTLGSDERNANVVRRYVGRADLVVPATAMPSAD